MMEKAMEGGATRQNKRETRSSQAFRTDQTAQLRHGLIPVAPAWPELKPGDDDSSRQINSCTMGR